MAAETATATATGRNARSTDHRPAETRRGGKQRTDLTVKQILAWADTYHAAHGRWPAISSGPIPGTAHDTWSKVNAALRQGLCGLPGGSSLARLLAQHGRVS